MTGKKTKRVDEFRMRASEFEEIMRQALSAPPAIKKQKRRKSRKK